MEDGAPESAEFATQRNKARHLHARQTRAVDLLAAGTPAADVARELGVDRTTLWRWRREPAFVAELNARRADLWQATTDRLRALLPRALAALERAIEQDDWRAAATVLRLARVNNSTLSAIGPVDADDVVAEEERRHSAQRRARQFEERMAAEEEVRAVEDARNHEFRQLLAQ
jgi:Helix-turn-helix of insertion element transposase